MGSTSLLVMSGIVFTDLFLCIWAVSLITRHNYRGLKGLLALIVCIGAFFNAIDIVSVYYFVNFTRASSPFTLYGALGVFISIIAIYLVTDQIKEERTE